MQSEVLREHLVVALDILRRRWAVFILPIAIAITLSVIAVKAAPMRYVAKSLILLQSANKSTRINNWAPQRIAAEQRLLADEQVGGIEAWLKSDQVLEKLLPELTANDLRYSTRSQRLDAINALRRALTLELISSSILEVRLEGPSPHGLGRKLEIIVSRLMEGLTAPEQNILNAPQFVLVRRREKAVEADRALVTAIKSAGLGPEDKVRGQLHQLRDILKELNNQRQAQSARAAPAPPLARADSDGLVKKAAEIRESISQDPAVRRELEGLFAAHLSAQRRYEDMKERGSDQLNNYVSIFDTPENLMVIGRPEDPAVGESSVKKLAIAGLLLSGIAGMGLVFLVEMLAGPLRTRREFERASGLPVVARIGARP